ncbi:MAG TPA: TolC family protein [Planctomycetia bacterium]|nr:TolC family protein [Planctomycetia bacterium]
MQRSAGSLLALTAMLAGCHKPYVNTETDYAYYNRISGEYANRARFDDIQQVATDVPSTVRDLGNEEIYKLTLQEVKQLALTGNKRIAYLGYQPGEQGTRIDAALSAFDAQFGFGGAWSRTERQVSSLVQNFGTQRDAFVQKAFGTPAGGFGDNLTGGGATDGGPGIPNIGMIDIGKRNATGGVTRFSYNMDYQKSDPAGFAAVNPSWTGTAAIAIQQPVLQGAGVEFNRSQILIARANFEQSIKDFDTQVRALLRDVEIAYWTLYFSYQDVYSREVGMEQALVAWQKASTKFEFGASNLFDVAQAREQFYFFSDALITTQNRLLNAEADLRRLMGMPPGDKRRIIPADKPTEAQYMPNWTVAVGEAMELRPELASQRLVVRAAEIQLSRQKNGLLPDLTLGASYGLSGLDNQLDQSFNRLLSNKFTEWRLGFRYTRALGERAANAAVRNAQLALSRERARMADLEVETIHELSRAFRDVTARFERIERQRQRRRAAAEQLQARKDTYEVGKETIDFLIRAQSVFADALRDENQAVVEYNQALATWEFAKGTILANDNVTLAEEICSNVSDAMRMRVQRQLLNAKPLPIHQGDKVHHDTTQCPDNTLPLFPPRGPAVLPTETPAGATAPKPSPDKDATKVPPATAPSAPLKPGTPANPPPPPAIDKPILPPTKVAPPPPNPKGSSDAKKTADYAPLPGSDIAGEAADLDAVATPRSSAGRPATTANKASYYPDKTWK